MLTGVGRSETDYAVIRSDSSHVRLLGDLVCKHTEESGCFISLDAVFVHCIATHYMFSFAHDQGLDWGGGGS